MILTFRALIGLQIKSKLLAIVSSSYPHPPPKKKHKTNILFLFFNMSKECECDISGKNREIPQFVHFFIAKIVNINNTDKYFFFTFYTLLYFFIIQFKATGGDTATVDQ